MNIDIVTNGTSRFIGIRLPSTFRLFIIENLTVCIGNHRSCVTHQQPMLGKPITYQFSNTSKFSLIGSVN